MFHTVLLVLLTLLSSCKNEQGAFPYHITDEAPDRELSAAMYRSFNNYLSPHMSENELYTLFKYTPIDGLDYNGLDGTISRRDPSKVILENGKYYMWYTKRHTPVKPMGNVWAKDYKNTPPPPGEEPWNDTIPSVDWDLSEIWYATSEDGFTWEEQGVAVPRPPEPMPGWRSVATPDILKFKGKYYLYYQAFEEAPGTRGDYCPVSVAVADSPDGPWTALDKVVVPTGEEGEWDQFAVHDPTPLVHDGKIYMYYKSAYNRPNTVVVAMGLAISEDPVGVFEKHPLNPVLACGHEVCVFPFMEGAAFLGIIDGNEHFTVQYAEDWVNFEIASIVEMMPKGNAFIPDAFADNGDGRGITWGIHFFYGQNGCCYLARFDCDLSLDVHDPEMKGKNAMDAEYYFKHGLSETQRERIKEENLGITGLDQQ